MCRNGSASALILVCGLICGLTPAFAGTGRVPLTAIRFGHDADRVRIVLDLATTVPFTWDMAGDGRHLTVTLIDIDWRPAKTQTLQTAGPLVRYRFEPALGGAGQVELEAVKPLRVLSVRELATGNGAAVHRIVIDLAPEPEGPKPATGTADPLEQGVRAILGLDGPADFVRAAEAFTRAAEAGNVRAAFNLGELYRAGKGVPQDYRQAAAWFERAAAAGFAPAQFHLAVLAFNGVGVPRDRDRARDLVQKAATQGLAQARQALDELNRVATP